MQSCRQLFLRVLSSIGHGRPTTGAAVSKIHHKKSIFIPFAPAKIIVHHKFPHIFVRRKNKYRGRDKNPSYSLLVKISEKIGHGVFAVDVVTEGRPVWVVPIEPRRTVVVERRRHCDTPKRAAMQRRFDAVCANEFLRQAFCVSDRPTRTGPPLREHVTDLGRFTIHSSTPSCGSPAELCAFRPLTDASVALRSISATTAVLEAPFGRRSCVPNTM